MSDEEELPEYQYEEYVVDEWEDWLKPFSPHQLNTLPKLLYLPSPKLTTYQVYQTRWREFTPNVSSLPVGNGTEDIPSFVEDEPQEVYN